jgi:hypothetical protein
LNADAFFPFLVDCFILRNAAQVERLIEHYRPSYKLRIDIKNYSNLFETFIKVFPIIRNNSYTLERAKYWDKPEQSKLGGFFPILSWNFWDRLRLKLLAIPNQAPCTKYWTDFHRPMLRIRQRNPFSIWTIFSDSISIWKFTIQAKAFKVIRCCICIQALLLGLSEHPR